MFIKSQQVSLIIFLICGTMFIQHKITKQARFIVMVLADLYSEMAIKLYGAASTLLVIPIHKWWKARKLANEQILNRITTLEQDVKVFSVKQELMVKSMDEDREERKDTNRMIREMHDTLSDLRVQAAVNTSKLK